MTLYLKYRPQKIADLDLAEVRGILAAMLSKKDLPHAFLFTGPWGTGKTSAARIIAKVVNCEQRKDGEPCNKCAMCREITAGSATDVIEIDAASNRGIEEIRDLREKVRLAPMRAKYKVYIIDEVHMLTNEAANALLKTLEEPPERTLFILCTTEPEKMLETVKSRCAWVKFKKPTAAEAVASLEHVVDGEKVKWTSAALALVARAARGSFRDGTKILEQVIMAKNEVSEETVREVLGWLAKADPEEFLRLVRAGQTGPALQFIAGLVKDGVNLRSWVERVVEELREELLEKIKVQGSSFNFESILKEIAGMDKVYGQMKSAAVVQLPLEIFVIENSSALPAKSQVQKTNQIPNSNDRNSDNAPSDPPVTAKTRVEKEEKEVVGEVGQNPPSLIEEGEKEEVHSLGRGKFKLQDVAERWPEIMKQVRPKNHSVEALLRSTKPTDFDGENLTLEVFYKFHKDKLETEKCRMIVEGAVAEVFGVGPVKLFLKLGDKKSNNDSARDSLSGAVEEDIVKAAEAIFKVDAM